MKAKKMKQLFVGLGVVALLMIGLVWFNEQDNVQLIIEDEPGVTDGIDDASVELAVDNESAPVLTADAPEPVIWGEFSGLLPCADCEGIEVSLLLFSEEEHIDAGTFALAEVYVGKNDEDFVSKGQWTTLRGMPGDDNATVIQLDSENAGEARYFVRVGEDKVEMLDKDMKRISSNLNYTLERQ